MILLDRNSVNKFYLTLTSDNLITGITYSGFTLSIYSINTSQSFSIDNTLHTKRYDEFILSGSSITIPSGFYDYKILYQGLELEVGKVEIKGTVPIKLTDTTNTNRQILTDTR